MDIICTPTGIINRDSPRQGVMAISEAGFNDILLDISLYCTQWELENIGRRRPRNKDNQIKASEHPEKMQEMLHPLLKECNNFGISTKTAYAPYLMRNTKHTDLNDLMRKLAKESIKIAAYAGCCYIVIRPLYSGVSDIDLWKCNREYYLELAGVAKEYDIMILLENQCKDKNGHLIRGICSDTVCTTEWIDLLNEETGEERFGFCMDVGVCSLCGQNMYDFVFAMGDRLKAVILRDCDGIHDNALMPFTCYNQGNLQTDWLNLIRGLRNICFDGQLILNIKDTMNAFSPLLRPGFLVVAKSVADYFEWQIGIENVLKKYSSLVLFGAGNMCRNYMKCYGEKYPPLYTCDNNRTLWGESFCGLEVKNPECLKSLEKGCAVIICNIYYREIGEQLREMGIENPVEYFNDEYILSF